LYKNDRILTITDKKAALSSPSISTAMPDMSMFPNTKMRIYYSTDEYWTWMIGPNTTNAIQYPESPQMNGSCIGHCPEKGNVPPKLATLRNSIDPIVYIASNSTHTYYIDSKGAVHQSASHDTGATAVKNTDKMRAVICINHVFLFLGNDSTTLYCLKGETIQKCTMGFE